MAQHSVLPAKPHRPVPDLSAYLSNPGVSCVLAELRYRPAALADLEDIFRGVQQVSGSPVVARRYVERIRARCRLIPTLPHAGRPRDDLAPGLRTVAFERRAVIVYRLVGAVVEITNVFHGGRDYAALYRRGEAEGDD